MTTENLVRTFRAVNRRQPFQRFFIEFNSGDRVTVTHPEAVGRTDQIFLFRDTDRSYRLFDASSVTQVIVPPSA